MIAYASRTGTRRNLDALRRAGWRLLVSATGALRHEGFRYALDNGAWTAHQQGRPFDEERFQRAFDLLGEEADFVVLPDIVAGGLRSLELSIRWLARLSRTNARFLLPVQDGVKLGDVSQALGERVGIFIGGSTDWKLKTAHCWAVFGHSLGCLVHMGRVNTVWRLRLCAAAGVDSFDGSSVSRYAVTLPKLDAARRTGDLLAGDVPRESWDDLGLRLVT